MIVILLALFSLGSMAPQATATWITVETPEGKAVMGFRAENTPYSMEATPQVSEHFSSGQPPTDTKGRVISGAGFYGWKDAEDADTVHVVVLMLVPDADAENRFYPREDRRLHYEVLSRFEMKRGEVRQTEELTHLFRGRRMAVRVGTQR